MVSIQSMSKPRTKKVQLGGNFQYQIGGVSGNRFLKFFIPAGEWIIADGGQCHTWMIVLLYN